MPEHGIIAKEIVFPADEIKTDSLLYKEKSYLLIPEPFTQNLFYAISDDKQANFFIASESLLNLGRMEAFFRLVYGASFIESAASPKHAGPATIMRSTSLNARTREFYHPRFVRNILDYANVDRSAKISYCVTIRSGRISPRGRRRFNIGVSVGFDSDLSKAKFNELIRNELGILRKDSRFRLRISKNGRISDRTLSESFNLINFIRIPSEHDLAV